MLTQEDFKHKWNSMTEGFKSIWDKFAHRDHDRETYSQADGTVYGDIQEDKEKMKSDVLSDESSAGQKMVWENEEASLQDKTYSFDEDTTDADYTNEDDLNFQDDSGEYDSDLDKYQ